MRKQPTASERLLWAERSGGRLGVWFRRQVVVGTSIVDFMAPARKLVVEVDGGYHADVRRQRADAGRDSRLERAGYRVLRLLAGLVLGNYRAPSSKLVTCTNAGAPSPTAARADAVQAASEASTGEAGVGLDGGESQPAALSRTSAARRGLPTPVGPSGRRPPAHRGKRSGNE